MRNINVILGPTSTGKTTLAIELCKATNGAIVSADSRQIFKYMDIGTGKDPIKSSYTVTKADNCWIMDDVEIWGYDLTTPDIYYSAYDYATFALLKIRELLGKGKTVFIVGGTGFYIDILTGRAELSGVEPNFELRNILEAVPTENLQVWLTSLNLEKSQSIDKFNRARLIRAIEIELSDGENSPTPLPYLDDVKFNFIGLTGSRELLYKKVDNWIDHIWKNGLIEEVEFLISSGYKNSKPLNGLIYKSVLAMFLEEINEDEAKDRAKFDLHSYIRRQQTWFKKNNMISWLDIENSNLSQKASNLVL